MMHRAFDPTLAPTVFGHLFGGKAAPRHRQPLCDLRGKPEAWIPTNRMAYLCVTLGFAMVLWVVTR